MKKIFILSTITIFSIIKSYGQIEFAPQGSKWYVNEEYCSSTEPSQFDEFEILEYEKDTTINNVEGKIIGNQIYYQEGYKVFILKNDTFRLIYDYDVKMLDTVEFYLTYCDDRQYVKFLIDSVSPVQINNITINKFTASSLEPSFQVNYTYYEKFGSLGTISDDDFCEVRLACFAPKFLRCYQDNQIFFKSPFYQEYGDFPCDYIETTNVNNLELVNLNIFPNPARNNINLENKSGYKIDEIIIYHINGQKLLNFKEKNQSFYQNIDISNLNKGVYVMKININNKTKNFRFIKF